MRTREQIDDDLDVITQSHYYSEDYELEWAARNYFNGLDETERRVFVELMGDRLARMGSLADITMCARIAAPEWVPILVEMLNRETESSQRTRAVMLALSHYPEESVYQAIERFVDSDQEGEALALLARIRFQRTLPLLRRALKSPHLHNHCLHILYEQKKRHSLEQVILDLKKLVEPSPADLLPCVRLVLRCKSGKYNPFTSEEIERMETALDG